MVEQNLTEFVQVHPTDAGLQEKENALLKGKRLWVSAAL